MTDRKNKRPSASLDISFGEAIGRFAQTKPGELADAIARDLASRVKVANERIEAARGDIKRGARSGKKRFSI